jgi:hypothetical protein
VGRTTLPRLATPSGPCAYASPWATRRRATLTATPGGADQGSGQGRARFAGPGQPAVRRRRRRAPGPVRIKNHRRPCAYRADAFPGDSGSCILTTARPLGVRTETAVARPNQAPEAAHGRALAARESIKPGLLPLSAEAEAMASPFRVTLPRATVVPENATARTPSTNIRPCRKGNQRDQRNAAGYNDRQADPAERRNLS